MESRVAVMSIIVENTNSIEKINNLLHDYAQYIIGRMGIPHREKNINIISVAIDGPQDKIAALSGKIGSLNGVNVKTAYSNI
ncbi:MAG: iron-only hydrogenase system regulator [Candidatus Riflebacteria bacterium]|nr:iron-only hydrogenase system regulator [Candidatus Riflebacteria bacterium]